MQVELKILDPRLPGWGFPRYGSEQAAALDLHACLEAPLTLAPGDPPALVSAGFAMRLGAPGWCGIVAPRSGLGHRGLVLGNTIGVIDADYEGPVLLSAWNRNAPCPEPGSGRITIAPGDRIAQLLFVPALRPAFLLREELKGSSKRGERGFGSTGVGSG